MMLERVWKALTKFHLCQDSLARQGVFVYFQDGLMTDEESTLDSIRMRGERRREF